MNIEHWFETLDRGQTDTWVLCWVDSLDYQARTTRKMVVGYRRYLINCGYPSSNMFYTSDGCGYHFATPCEVTA